MVELRLRHFVTDRLSVGGTIPTGFIRFDAGGGNENIQRATGFGDIELLTRYSLLRGSGYATNIDVEGAIALPTGRSSLSSAQAGAEAPPNLLSLGRGVFGLRTRVALSRFFSKDWGVRAWVDAASPLSASASNIVFGKRFGGGIGVTYLPKKDWALAPQLSFSQMTHARSTINGELINSGGSWLNADLIGSWRVRDDVSISLTARVPVYRDVNGSQITESFTGILQFGYRFGLEEEEEEEEEHDHGKEEQHEHGEEHNHEEATVDQDGHDHGDGHENTEPHDASSDGDIADAARGGESFDRDAIAVIGKITIVDFWAKWCGPCGPLTHGLEKLAKQHPSIALRKVEVPDFDTPVAKTYLAKAKGLPLVWVYDATGKRVHVFEQKKLDEISGAIEKLIIADK